MTKCLAQFLTKSLSTLRNSHELMLHYSCFSQFSFIIIPKLSDKLLKYPNTFQSQSTNLLHIPLINLVQSFKNDVVGFITPLFSVAILSINYLPQCCGNITD